MLSLLAIASAHAATLFPIPRHFETFDATPIKLSSNFVFRSKHSSKTHPFLHKGIARTGTSVLRNVEKTTEVSSKDLLDAATIHVRDEVEEQIPSINTDYTYQIRLQNGVADLIANSTAGALYAMESFRQLAADGSVPSSFFVDDGPQYNHRGLMLDSGRRWWPVDSVKDAIQTMHLAKYNVLHLHLSDAGRLAVESKKFPLLNSVGSLGSHWKGHYSQSEIHDIVQYATERSIRVIPEIDLPGHQPEVYAEIADQIPFKLCPGSNTHGNIQLYDDPKNITYAFLDTLLTEIAGLFPDEVFHIGTDETSTEGVCTLEVLAGLENKIIKIVGKSGKKSAGWNEIVGVAHPPVNSTIIYAWIAQPPGIIAKGYDVVNSDAGHFYIVGGGQSGTPKEWSNFYYNISTGVPDVNRSRLLGGEVSFWGDQYCPNVVCVPTKPPGSAREFFPPNPTTNAAFRKSTGGMLWPRAFVGGQSFWFYDESINATSDKFANAIWALNEQAAKDGLEVCPKGVRCDLNSRNGVPYLNSTF